MCHVSAKHCRSTTLGISVVTVNLCLHDTWSQNMSLEMQAHPPRNTQTHTHTHINVKIFASSLSGAGATNCSDRV